MSKKIIEALETVIEGLMALKRELVADSMEPTVRPAHELKTEMTKRQTTWVCSVCGHDNYVDTGETHAHVDQPAPVHFICPDCNYTCNQTGRGRHTHIRCNHTLDFHHRWADCDGIFVTDYCPMGRYESNSVRAKHTWRYLPSETAYECSACYQVTYKVPTFRCPSCDFVCFGERSLQHRHDDCDVSPSMTTVHHIVTKGCK